MKNGSTIGILVVAHANLAEGLIGAAEQILGPQHALKAISLDATTANPKDQIEAAAAELETGAGVLVITDLFGGTPSNLAIAVCNGHKMEVVTGANLPLLLRALSKREELPLADLARVVADYGRQQILTPSQMLSKASST